MATQCLTCTPQTMVYMDKARFTQTYTHLVPCTTQPCASPHVSLCGGGTNLQQKVCVNKRWLAEAIVVFTLADPLCAVNGWRYSNSQTQKGPVCRRAGCSHSFTRGLCRKETRQLLGLTGNAVVTVSTAAPMATHDKRLPTTGRIKSCVFR